MQTRPHHFILFVLKEDEKFMPLISYFICRRVDTKLGLVKNKNPSAYGEGIKYILSMC